MKQSVYFSDFADAFKDIRPNNFSDEGLSILWDYLEQLEDDLSEELELDVIALCCDYSEESYLDILSNLDIDEEDLEGLDEDEVAEKVAEELSDRTTVLGTTSDNQIIFQVY